MKLLHCCNGYRIHLRCKMTEVLTPLAFSWIRERGKEKCRLQFQIPPTGTKICFKFFSNFVSTSLLSLQMYLLIWKCQCKPSDSNFSFLLILKSRKNTTIKNEVTLHLKSITTWPQGHPIFHRPCPTLRSLLTFTLDRSVENVFFSSIFFI